MNIIKPVFWSEKNFLSLLLYPLTALTFLINLIKKFSVKKKFSIKTICIGNICVGGTGKTPLSIKIDKILKKKYKTVFVKKKYSDQSDEQSLLRSNGNLATTTTIPAQLIKKYKCQLVPIYIKRYNNFYFKMYVSKPIIVNSKKSIEEITLFLNNILEKMIIKNLDQWIWTHDRWKK